MTTLIVGGTGKTGSILARLLDAANQPVLITSRKGVAPHGVPFKAVEFDWFDASTFKNPFEADNNITRLYLFSPGRKDAVNIVKPFLDLAVEKGVKRIVFCSASAEQRGSSFWLGGVHDYIAELGVEYAVLKPTWFIENFSTNFYNSIREQNLVISAAGDGRIPFISVEDIAQVAFEKLTEEKAANSDFLVLGPQLHTYDEAAELLSEVLGRKIVHKRVTEEEMGSIYARFIEEPCAKALAHVEALAATGGEERQNEPSAIIGKKTLREYFTEKRSIWIKE